ncbi:LysR family transcriptional regulator [Xenophilus arseniciresistens]|uniref:LysR family transcriptional regulator n=1 Tax=Xenophilus arseniciresistens TaxID=1283306 RepID=A0AAE3N9I4_9BURK|nr:LysR family transcriptional regulator [Xenophilus arseniciresistens]MDA7417103.1 LysR family transcriptional regulator [Xenophilus arseniciresistens]
MELPSQIVYRRLLTKLSFKHIQSVVLTAQFGSTHKAAELSGLNQPSIAKFLNAVEELVGEALFERHARGMRITPAGSAMLPLFSGMLRLLENGSQALHAVQSGSTGALQVAALPAACRAGVMRGIAAFMLKHPQFKLHMEEAGLSQLRKFLETGACDVILMRPPPSLPDGYRFDPILQDHSVVLARRGHRLEGRKGLTLETLAREHWLVPPPGITSRMIFDSWFATVPNYPAVVNIATDSFSALSAFVAESDALLVVPFNFAEPALSSGRIVALNVQRREELPPLGIVWHPESASVATATFSRWMKSDVWKH